jgi:hypothetical protein
MKNLGIVSGVEETARWENLQDSDKNDGDNGLPCCELRSTSDDPVVHTLAACLLSDNILNRGTTSLLLVNLLEGRFLRTIHAEDLHLEWR